MWSCDRGLCGALNDDQDENHDGIVLGGDATMDCVVVHARSWMIDRRPLYLR